MGEIGLGRCHTDEGWKKLGRGARDEQLGV
jgi:hypothetical protein